MSASDKKKLRKEQTAELLSEKQRQQQAEDKKLKVYTTIFLAAMALVVCVALAVLGVRAVNNSGIIQKSTVAATVGERELNTVELGYYYNDAVSEYYNDWYDQSSGNPDTYLLMMGLDTSKPLDEQTNPETEQTWAEYFIDTAIEKAKNDFAMYDLAMAEGFTLSDEDQTNVDNMINNMETYATIYGYSNADQYLRAMYGYGSDLDSYTEYYERTEIARAYKEAHEESLSYDDAAIREHEADKYNDYSSYTYTSVYMSYTAFQQGGTADENGTLTYSDEENDAARAALKAAAETLATATSVEDLNAKVAATELKEGSSLSVTENERVLYTTISASNADLATWLADAERKEGDIAAIPVTATNEADEETEQTNGYYVAIFHTCHDNKEAMANVRHLLVEFEGGEENEETGEVTYSDEEKAAAKEEAEGYLKTWQEGEKTEDSFIALVKENSDDTSAEDGGLFEDIHPDSSYVENFLNWSIDPNRVAGDTEVIETEYGYHVMYYVGDDEMTYRDYMISAELRAAEQEEWYNGIMDAITTSVGDTSKMNLDLILSPES